jgi:hypothetical protein
VGAAVCHCAAPHCVSAAHWRSTPADAAADCHCPATHVVCVAHARSDVAVAAAVSYSLCSGAAQ